MKCVLVRLNVDDDDDDDDLVNQQSTSDQVNRMWTVDEIVC